LPISRSAHAGAGFSSWVRWKKRPETAANSGAEAK
jgi:hypothetical protein